MLGTMRVNGVQSLAAACSRLRPPCRPHPQAAIAAEYLKLRNCKVRCRTRICCAKPVGAAWGASARIGCGFDQYRRSRHISTIS